MSCLGREADSADGARHETLRCVELDSRHHSGGGERRKEDSAEQAEDVRNDTYEEGYHRRDIR